MGIKKLLVLSSQTIFKAGKGEPMKYYILIILMFSLTFGADSLTLYKAFAPVVEKEYPALFNDFDPSRIRSVYDGDSTEKSILRAQEISTDQIRYVPLTLDQWVQNMQRAQEKGRRFEVGTELCTFFADEKVPGRYWVLFREKWCTSLDKQVISWQYSYHVLPLTYKKGRTATLLPKSIKSRIVVFLNRRSTLLAPDLVRFEDDWRKHFFTKSRGVPSELHEKILAAVLADIATRERN